MSILPCPLGGRGKEGRQGQERRKVGEGGAEGDGATAAARALECKRK